MLPFAPYGPAHMPHPVCSHRAPGRRACPGAKSVARKWSCCTVVSVSALGDGSGGRSLTLPVRGEQTTTWHVQRRCQAPRTDGRTG